MARAANVPASPALVAFAKRLETLMANAGLNQSQLAARANSLAAEGVSVRRDDINRFIHTKHEPTRPKLEAIAAALNVTPDSLFPENLRAKAERPWRASSSVAMETLEGGKTARVYVSRVLPTAIALKILQMVEEHAILPEDIQPCPDPDDTPPARPTRPAKLPKK